MLNAPSRMYSTFMIWDSNYWCKHLSWNLWVKLICYTLHTKDALDRWIRNSIIIHASIILTCRGCVCVTHSDSWRNSNISININEYFDIFRTATECYMCCIILTNLISSEVENCTQLELFSFLRSQHCFVPMIRMLSFQSKLFSTKIETFVSIKLLWIFQWMNVSLSTKVFFSIFKAHSN